MRLIILGPPGTGKGTQAKVLADKLNLTHLSTGDMLRKEVAEKTELGRKVEKIMKEGKLVSDHIILDLVKKNITLSFILDGFPRTLNQAKALEKLTTIEKVVCLESSKEIIIERLKGRAKKEGREDDCPDAIAERFREYDEATKPLIAFYKNKLIKIDGNQAVEKVTKDILKALQ